MANPQSVGLLEPTLPNLRAEKARYNIRISELVEAGAGTQNSLVSMYISGGRKATARTHARIVRALNTVIYNKVGFKPFDESHLVEWGKTT